MSLLLAIVLAIVLAWKQYVSALAALPVAFGLAIVSVCFSQAALWVTGLSSALVKTFQQNQEIHAITDTIRLDALEFLKAYCEYYTVFLEVLDALAKARALSTDETALLSRCIMNVKANFIPGSKLSKSLSRKAKYLRARYNKCYGSLGGAV
ncbi:hypothetical protein K525DRAFT_249131 [Schizophyllum commune Loenen D]|nr:hypothetical protein K525DRAFT_249131 [Schizophyllum commune Loenen D]